MKSIPILLFVVATLVSVCESKDLIVGTSFNQKLIWQEKVEYNSIPFKKRVKEVFYNDPGNQIIRGVIARDLDHTDAVPSITAGGPGFSFANMRFKSERGSGLNYQLEIYV